MAEARKLKSVLRFHTGWARNFRPVVSKSRFPNPMTTHHFGVTARVGGLTGSEVWKRFSGVDAIASLIFHEAMHNKLQLDDGLHGRYRPCQLSCGEIHWPTSPSREESQAMAAALMNPVRQWTEGQGILTKARIARNEGDPYWNNAIMWRSAAAD